MVKDLSLPNYTGTWLPNYFYPPDYGHVASIELLELNALMFNLYTVLSLVREGLRTWAYLTTRVRGFWSSSTPRTTDTLPAASYWSWTRSPGPSPAADAGPRVEPEFFITPFFMISIDQSLDIEYPKCFDFFQHFLSIDIKNGLHFSQIGSSFFLRFGSGFSLSDDWIRIQTFWRVSPGFIQSESGSTNIICVHLKWLS